MVGRKTYYAVSEIKRLLDEKRTMRKAVSITHYPIFTTYNSKLKSLSLLIIDTSEKKYSIRCNFPNVRSSLHYKMETEYFKHTILPLKDKLFRKALSITESINDAEDIVQEVMMRMWDKRTEWKTILNIEVYCMVMTKNFALDKMKRKGFYSESIDDSKPDVFPHIYHDQSDEIVKEEKVKLIWRIIGLLPLQQQTLIRLREIEELSYQDIASEMNITEAQVKVTLFRARQKIKETYLKINRNNDY